MEREPSGFTLIELLVVISIIALLSSVVLASLNAAREKARIAAVRSFAAQVDRVAGEQAVGIWDFDDCAPSATATDRSGYANNGTLAVGATWSTDTPSGRGCSVSLAAGSSWVNMGSSDLFNFKAGDSFTISIWVRPTIADLSGTPRIVYRISGNAGYMLSPNNGTLRFMMGDGTALNPSNAGLLQADKWQHIAATWDGSTRLVYVDGVLRATNPYTNLSASAGSLMVGANAGGGNQWTGLIDEVRVFTKVLTASEVGGLYAEFAPRFKYAHEE